MKESVRVAIVGGGFSGAVVAVQLVRLLPVAASVVVIEPRAMVGAGLAYSADDPAHRINVPAARMTVFAEDPGHFEWWLRQTHALREDPVALADGDVFPQRAWFGRYVAELFATACSARPDVAVSHRRARVIEVDACPSSPFRLRLDDDTTTPADIVVLAATHPPPNVPEILRAALADGRGIVPDPWRPGALDGIAPDASVLVIGTGLTMADVVAALEGRGHRGPVLAISRRGLLSRGHPPSSARTHEWFGTCAPPPTALALSSAVRRQVESAAIAGMPWQAVFDDVRSHAGRLWSALSPCERRRVVRHLRPFWDVHRFRAAPQAIASIERQRRAGRLRVFAASLVGATSRLSKVEVTLRRRDGAVEIMSVDAVVVTTGPAHGTALRDNPALASLARQGLLRADPSDLGIDVDDGSRPVGQDGSVRPGLFVAGPLARGRFGELMGLPQVSAHAEFVARRIVQAIAGV